MSAPVLLITGGSRGIGAAVAIEAARQGYAVMITYASNATRARAVVEQIRAAGGRAESVQADTAHEADIERAFAAADALGPLAVVVYNVGITGANSSLVDAATATIDEVLAVNLRGAILASRAAIRRMSTRLGGQGGSIVMISSRATFYGSPNEYVWYAASKGGMDSLVNGLSREVAAEGIRVNTVSPGPIETEIHRPGRLDAVRERVPMKRIGSPEEVAATVLFLASPAASYVTGANLAVGGGL
jgi:NAD(P)-dependent dehydrogenase (short-subunit alcohol dehydrogenase family)